MIALIQINLEDLSRNINYWTGTEDLLISYHDQRPGGAVWGVGNCLITARQVSTTKTELTLFRYLKVFQDEIAYSCWNKVLSLIEEYQYPLLDLSSDRKVKETLSIFDPYYDYQKMESWLEEWEARSSMTYADAAAEFFQKLETLPIVEGGDEQKKDRRLEPWEKILEHSWDRMAVELWHRGFSSPEIAYRVGKASKTVTNRLSVLRLRYGDEIIPYDEQRKRKNL